MMTVCDNMCSYCSRSPAVLQIISADCEVKWRCLIPRADGSKIWRNLANFAHLLCNCWFRRTLPMWEYIGGW